MPDAGHALELIERIATVIESHVPHFGDDTSAVDLLPSEGVVELPLTGESLENSEILDANALPTLNSHYGERP